MRFCMLPKFPRVAPSVLQRPLDQRDRVLEGEERLYQPCVVGGRCGFSTSFPPIWIGTMRGGQVIGLHYSDTVPMLDIEVIQMLVQFGANTHGRIVDCTVGQKNSVSWRSGVRVKS